MKQLVYGFKISAKDGAESHWHFVNDEQDPLWLHIRLQTGVRYIYDMDVPSLYNWAHNRELTVHRCVFQFDPDAMTMKQVLEPFTA